MAVRRLDLIITSNAQAALRGFASLEGAAKSMENRFGKAGRALFNLGVIGAAATVAFTAKSVKAFIEFDDAMTRSTAILDNVSGPVRKRLEEAAKSIARTTTFSASEAAEAFYGLFSAGLDAEQAISAIPVVAQFAQAALMDMGEATDYLVNAQAALGLSMEDPIENMKQMQRVADVLTETNNLATGTVEEFAEALTHKAGGALKTVGKDIEEGAAALAYLAEQGVRGSRAGESLAIFIRDVSRAAGNPAFKDAFRDFGIEVFDSTGNLKNLADVVAEFETALGPMSDKQRAVALEQLGLTRSVGDVIRQLMGGSEEIRKYEEALRNAGGATEEVANKQMESLKSQLDLIKNKLNVLMIEFGEPVAIWLVEVFFPWFETKFLPALEDMISLVRKDLRPAFDGLSAAFNNKAFLQFFTAFVAFYTTIKAGSAIWGAIVTVFRTLAVVVKPLMFLFRVVVAFLKEINFAFFAIRYFIVVVVIPALEGLAAVLGISVGWLLVIIAAIIAVIAIIIIFAEEIGGALIAVGGFFVNLWDAIFSGFVRPIINFFTGPFVDFWQAVWEKVESAIRVFLTVAKVIFNVLIVIVFGRLIVLAGIVVAIVGAIVGFFMKFWPQIWDVVQFVWGLVVDGTRIAFNFVRDLLVSVWHLIYNQIYQRVVDIWHAIRDTWDLVFEATMTAWHAITTALFYAWTWIRDNVIAPLVAVWGLVVVPAFNAFTSFLSDLWEGIKFIFSAAWQWIYDNVVSHIMNVWEGEVMPPLRTFRDFLGRIWQSILDTASTVWGNIVQVIAGPVNVIISVINGLIEGINTVLDLINKIPGVDIPEIPKIPRVNTNSSGGNSLNINPGMAGVSHNAMGTYNLAKRGPFVTNGPRAIVGEGDARWPEYVIPTDPRFRNRAKMLFSSLGQYMGAPGDQFGGIVDSVSDAVGSAIDAVGGAIEGLERGALKAAFTPFNEAAKRGLNAAPNPLHLRDMAQGFRELIWRVITGADSGFPEASSTGGAGTTGGGLGGSRAANRLLGKMLNAQQGWGAHWDALDRLVMSESGWSNTAQNPTSTAYGIGQFLNSTWASVGYRKTSSPLMQILAMFAYIKQRYGNPTAAWNFKKSHNWYRMGGLLPYGGDMGSMAQLAAGAMRVPRTGVAMLHQDELVASGPSADAIRDALGGKGGQRMTVNINSLNINIGQASSVEDARRKGRAAGKAFLDVLEERRVLTDARIS